VHGNWDYGNNNMELIKKFDSWIYEGVNWSDGNWSFNWVSDNPDDDMFLKFKKHRSRTQSVKGTDTTYSYFYAYHFEYSKTKGSTFNLINDLKMMDNRIDKNDIDILVNKAVIGFNSNYNLNSFDTIISPQSSSLILTKLTDQLQAKSGVTQLYSDSFVKTQSDKIQIDQKKFDRVPEKVQKEVSRVFNKVRTPGHKFKMKEIYSPHRKFFIDFIEFKNSEDRRFMNSITDKRIILVDDYRTSGSTIKEMIRLLANQGAAEIVVFVLINLN